MEQINLKDTGLFTSTDSIASFLKRNCVTTVTDLQAASATNTFIGRSNSISQARGILSLINYKFNDELFPFDTFYNTRIEEYYNPILRQKVKGLKVDFLSLGFQEGEVEIILDFVSRLPINTDFISLFKVISARYSYGKLNLRTQVFINKINLYISYYENAMSLPTGEKSQTFLSIELQKLSAEDKALENQILDLEKQRTELLLARDAIETEMTLRVLLNEKKGQ